MRARASHSRPVASPTGLRRAFTLIELLVVIALIGLLVSIIMPSLSRAKEIARHASCRSNLHNVGVGLRMYLNDSNDVMPVAAQLPSARLNDDPRIADLLAPYLQMPKLLKCPSDVAKNFYASEGSSYEYNSLLGGREVGETFLTRLLGESRTHVMHDYEPFHGPGGEVGSSNYLFADLHVGDMD